MAQALFLDPVIAADGHTYEKAAITEWLQEHQTSPVTGETLLHRHPCPQHTHQAGYCKSSVYLTCLEQHMCS